MVNIYIKYEYIHQKKNFAGYKFLRLSGFLAIYSSLYDITTLLNTNITNVVLYISQKLQFDSFIQYTYDKIYNFSLFIILRKFFQEKLGKNFTEYGKIL